MAFGTLDSCHSSLALFIMTLAVGALPRAFWRSSLRYDEKNTHSCKQACVHMYGWFSNDRFIHYVDTNTVYVRTFGTHFKFIHTLYYVHLLNTVNSSNPHSPAHSSRPLSPAHSSRPLSPAHSSRPLIPRLTELSHTHCSRSPASQPPAISPRCWGWLEMPGQVWTLQQGHPPRCL